MGVSQYDDDADDDDDDDDAGRKLKLKLKLKRCTVYLKIIILSCLFFSQSIHIFLSACIYKKCRRENILFIVIIDYW